MDGSLQDNRQIDAWLIDMDGVCYPRVHLETDLMVQSRGHYRDYIVARRPDLAGGIDQQAFEAQTLAHGSVYLAFRDLHGFDPQHMVDDIHDRVDISRVPRCPTLARQLDRLPGRKILFTSSPLNFAEKMTRHLGIRDCFAGLSALEHAGFFWKHRAEPFAAVIREYNLVPARTGFIDDTHVNHVQGRAHGLKTHHLHYDAPRRSEDYIDHSFPTLPHLLHHYVGPPLIAPAVVVRRRGPAP